MSDWVTVAKVGEIAPGGHRVVDVDGAHVAVFNIDGEHYAIEDVCTHDGDQIECMRHGARFCIRTGEVMAPPAYEPVAKFPVRIVDGLIQVRDDRWD